MTVVAWVTRESAPDPPALGPLPPGVTVVDGPREDVTFVIPDRAMEHRLHELPNLEVVQVLSAGVDWIVDQIPAGVTLCSARGTRDAAVAEWVVAALLADRKRLGAFARARTWDEVQLGDLADWRVLIVGHGSIGREAERLLSAFGVEVVGVARRARPGVHPLAELDGLLGDADAVVNLLPLTPETRGLVDAAFLGRLRDGTLYVNAGRGATTDTQALTDEVRSGRLRAVLDVVDPEPLPDGHPLWMAPGALISPHVAGDTPAGQRAAWALAAQQLRRHAAGEPLVNVVAAGY